MPDGSIATTSSPLVATTKRPYGDHDASSKRPRRRRAPFCWTTHGPLGELTSSRPGAGNENSSRCAFFTPTASRIELITERPGGLASTPATAATATIATAGFQ